MARNDCLIIIVKEEEDHTRPQHKPATDSQVGLPTGTSGHPPSPIPARYINSDRTLPFFSSISIVFQNYNLKGFVSKNC
ncbi:hypothetical protein L1887_16857 [Cichorium endivia]|nr:hypothetical protein L1887_16857 [Cichorium endivia]